MGAAEVIADALNLACLLHLRLTSEVAFNETSVAPLLTLVFTFIIALLLVAAIQYDASDSQRQHRSTRSTERLRETSEWPHAPRSDL